LAKMAIASIPFLALLALLAIVGVAANASAGLDTLPETLASALEISEDSAKMLLGTAILMSAGLCLAVTNANIITVGVVMLAVLGVLVLFDWVYEWVLIVVVIFIIAMFARDPMSNWFSRSSGD